MKEETKKITEIALLKEYNKSKENKKITNKFSKFLTSILINNLNRVDFPNESIKENCQDNAILELTDMWENYNPKLGKALVYYNNYSKRLITKAWNKLRRKEGKNYLSQIEVFKG